MKITDAKKGNKVYYKAFWSGFRTAAIIQSVETDANGKQYWRLQDTDGDIGETNRYPEDCYPTKEAYDIAIREKMQNEIKKYKNNMKTIEDMLNFALENVLSSGGCEYTNWTARKAFIERANELGFHIGEN